MSPYFAAKSDIRFAFPFLLNTFATCLDLNIMTLIKSISGIRGTIGGKPAHNLSPIDIVKFTAAFVVLLREQSGSTTSLRVVIGRDARISGDMVSRLVSATLMSMGADVVDLGLSTTPTVELAVSGLAAAGGIVLTASHNPAEWNALKLLNATGEFISSADGKRLLELSEMPLEFAELMQLGTYTTDDSWIDRHIAMILDLPLVDKEAVARAGFRIAVDGINSSGGIAVPALLKDLGVKEVFELNCIPDGNFAHNPEPLTEHLHDLSELVIAQKASLGFVVDPDVDRLAIVDENGAMFGEEYSLVAVADYILQNTPGPAVSNLSSTRALSDLCETYSCEYAAAAVGEVNVVEKMKEINAVIGGEGNGGIIYPALHYGRDALVGIALFLTYLAKQNKTCSELRQSYPNYVMLKNKVKIKPETNYESLIQNLVQEFENEKISTIDGVKIDFANAWLQLRKSNTEPIIRIYAEAKSMDEVEELVQRVLKLLEKDL